ncbi:hypothetical protein AVEN_137797-1, partial [Araneus ventricosus]
MSCFSVLAPLRGCCGVRGEWTCGTARAAWYHGPGLVFGPRGHETTNTSIINLMLQCI